MGEAHTGAIWQRLDEPRLHGLLDQVQQRIVPEPADLRPEVEGDLLADDGRDHELLLGRGVEPPHAPGDDLTQETWDTQVGQVAQYPAAIVLRQPPFLDSVTEQFAEEERVAFR